MFTSCTVFQELPSFFCSWIITGEFVFSPIRLEGITVAEFEQLFTERFVYFLLCLQRFIYKTVLPDSGSVVWLWTGRVRGKWKGKFPLKGKVMLINSNWRYLQKKDKGKWAFSPGISRIPWEQCRWHSFPLCWLVTNEREMTETHFPPLRGAQRGRGKSELLNKHL